MHSFPQSGSRDQVQYSLGSNHNLIPRMTRSMSKVHNVLNLNSLPPNKPKDNKMEIEDDGTMEFETTQQNRSISRDKSMKNLALGRSITQAAKFEFKRGRGQMIEQKDRHWILRLFYWFRSQNLYSNMSDFEVRKMIADNACCDQKSIKTIIDEGVIQRNDNRGHSMPKKIDDEETVKQNVLLNLKTNLD